MAVARWLLENPDRSLGECSRELGYTQPWLSQLIHSDSFQAHLRSLHDGADALVLQDIPSKLRGLAARALDGLAEQLEQAVELGEHEPMLQREFIKETAEMALHRLGYGPQRGGAVTVNASPQVQFVISQDDLAQARATIIDGAASVEGRRAASLLGEAPQLVNPECLS
jgi:hypothetical protein